MPINNRILENGIRLVTEPIATTEAVAIGFWFPAGSRDEGPGECGITHFVEHMLFKGTHDLSAYDIARFFDRIGGYVNAFTEREMLCVHCLVPRQYASEAIDVLLRMIYESSFTNDDIEKERSVITSEILSALDDPEETGMDHALASMYQGHAFSRPIAGTVDDVQSITAKQLRDFCLSFLQAHLPVVTVAGNVDEEMIASRLARLEFGQCLSDSRKSSVPKWTQGVSLPVSRFGQSQIYISYPIRDLSALKAWYAFSALNAIIGDTVSSRLYQSLRENKGLCYSVGSFFLCNRDSAFWMACSAVPPERTAETVDAALEEISRLKISGVSSDEIADAKNHLRGELLLSAEDTENRMKRLARQWFFAGEILSIPESARLIESIRDEDVRIFPDYLLNEGERSLVVFADKKRVREAGKKWKSNTR